MSTLAGGLVESGQRVVVALVIEPHEVEGHPVVDALAATGADVEVLDVAGRDYVGERRRVAELLKRRDADVLHTHGYRPDLVDASVARRLDVATATTVHGFCGGGLRNRVYEWLQVRAFRRFDAVLAVSDKLRGEITDAGVEPGRVHAIRNAWEPSTVAMPREEARRRLGLPSDVPVVAWVGRMSQEKAPDIMVQAAAKVRRPDVVFSMIGDGPERVACEEAASALGVDERIRWHGVVPDAGTVLRAFDAIVLTSWTEGTPMLLLEAMAAEVPIITTAVGGIPDVVSPAEASLCDAGDTEGIARAIDDVLDGRDESAARAEAAKSRLASQFAVRPWVHRHIDLYRTIAEN